MNAIKVPVKKDAAVEPKKKPVKIVEEVVEEKKAKVP